VLPIPLLPDDWKPGPACAPLISDRGGRLDMWKRMGAMLNERAAALSRMASSWAITTTIWNSARGGTTGWAVLLKELDPKLVFLELDLGWVTAGGLDPVAELRRLKGRVKMVHLKDIKSTTKTNYALRRTLRSGSGMLNWHKILPACVDRALKHYFVEQEAPFTHDRFESVKISHDFWPNRGVIGLRLAWRRWR
jgi:sugar phosphate isomerase/epimerase